ncbi:MAG: Ig-like domain-containing protein [Bradymonadia bacterium]
MSSPRRTCLAFSTLLILSTTAAEARRHPPPDRGARGAPRVVEVTPDGTADGAVRTIRVTFDQPIERGRVKINDHSGYVVCHPSFFEEQTFTVQVELSKSISSCPGGKISTRDDQTFTIRLARPIDEKRQVKVSLNPSHVRGRNGVQMRRPFEWSFYTRPKARVLVHAVESDGAGGYFVAGEVIGALEGTRSKGKEDAFIARYDARGELLWGKQFGTPQADAALDLALGPKGVVVVGYTDGAMPRSSSKGERDVFVRTYSLDGRPTMHTQVGSPHTEAAHGVAVDAKGMIYITGRSTRDLPSELRRKLPHDAYDILAMKLAPDGKVKWHRTYGTHVWRGDKLPADEGYDIALDARGRPVIVGETYGALHGKRNRGAPSGFVMALSTSGKHRWTRLSEDRNAYQSIKRQGDALLVAGVGPTIKGGTFVRYSAAGRRQAIEHYAGGGANSHQGVVFKRLATAGREAWLVGHQRRLDVAENTWRVVGMSWARVSRDGERKGRVHTHRLGQRASVLDAAVNDEGALCMAGTDAMKGFVRCVDDSGAHTVNISLRSSHRRAPRADMRMTRR